MALSDADFGLLQRSVDALVGHLAQLRLSLVVERDFGALITFLRSRNAPLINPTYHPKFNDLSKDSFWLRIIDETGESVASHAQRLFVTPDFCELVASGRLWYADGTKLDAGQDAVRITPPSTLIRGVVAHAGALWVDPSRRKVGLSLYLPFLSRALCLRNYDVDFFTCIVDRGVAQAGIPMHRYGYTHMEPFFDGWTPPANRNLKSVHLCYMSQAELLEQFRRLPTHPLFPVKLAPDRIREALSA